MISWLRGLLDRRRPTQDFVDLESINDGLFRTRWGTFCSVLEVKPLNLELFSGQEKQAVIAAYGNFLNSLTYSVQIVVTSRLVDIDEYLKDLRARCEEVNQLLAGRIEDYVEFIEQLVLKRRVLSRRFFVIISAGPAADPDEAYKTLSKRQGEILLGLRSVGLTVQILNDEEIRTLFYNLYNRRLSTYRWLLPEHSQLTSWCVRGGINNGKNI